MEDLRGKYPLLFEDPQKNRDKEQYKKAMHAIQKIAGILKQEFQATEVRLFGSLLEKERFTEFSDIDIAERGIPPSKFYKAYARITREVSDFNIDLVDMEDCKEAIKDVIDKEGVVIE